MSVGEFVKIGKHMPNIVKGYSIDCNYVHKVSDYMNLIPIILVSSGEDEIQR